MNPLKALLQSRKFWVLILDTVVSLITYFSTKYLAPAAVDDVKMLIAALQPIALMLIVSIAYEDGQNVKAGAAIEAAKVALIERSLN